MGRLALKQEAPREPLRAALAEALASLSEARAARDATTSGLIRAEDAVVTSLDQIRTAEADIREAKAQHREQLVASVMRGDAVPSNDRLATAEQRLAEAQASLLQAREARDEFKRLSDEAGDRLRMWEQTVRECAGRIAWAELPALIDAAAPHRRRLREIGEAVSLIRAHSPGFLAADDTLRKIERQAEDITAPVMAGPRDAALSGLTLEWSAALDRLMVDPDAELPATMPAA